jgi:hypothetical protein
MIPVPPFSWKGILKSFFTDPEPPRPFGLAWNTELPYSLESEGISNIESEISSRLRREPVVIEPRIGVDQIVVAYVLGELFRGDNPPITAYFSTAIPMEIQSKNFDIRILVVGLNCNTWDRFNIRINSWDDFEISKVTKFTLVKRAIKASIGFLKPLHVRVASFCSSFLSKVRSRSQPSMIALSPI